MRIAFVVDRLRSLDTDLDTSVGLMCAAHHRGHELWVTSAVSLEAVGGRARARARRLHVALSGTGRRNPWYTVGAAEHLWLDETAAVFMRTNPPVDRTYLNATFVLDLVDPDRTALVNDPRGLRRCNEKTYPLQFPDLIPPTVVTAVTETILGFLADHGRAVLKPIDGYAGRGVIVLDPADPNLRSLLELSTDAGRRVVVVQPFLAEVAAGNKRIFVLDGVPTAAVWRYPVDGDFRIGDPTEVAPVTDRDRDICARLAPALRRDGLRMVGLDVIGPHLIETNVTSPGALRKADVLLGTSLCADLVDTVTAPPHAKETP